MGGRLESDHARTVAEGGSGRKGLLPRNQQMHARLARTGRQLACEAARQRRLLRVAQSMRRLARDLRPDIRTSHKHQPQEHADQAARGGDRVCWWVGWGGGAGGGVWGGVGVGRKGGERADVVCRGGEGLGC